ncbi:transketolase [Rhizobium rhizogenes]|uniref:transketolase n=1 Tax=Rhizobium rhizogenes TaxID=359 RepID=UPI001573B955|nr:transketolase [Rhizobium rhizogenes]NTI76598.1 transketolase [Rhizobium rhizogenes]
MTHGREDVDQENLARCANVRRNIISAIATSGSGHPGGSLSCVEILVTLFFSVMEKRAERSTWPYKDRFVLSKGHADAAYYSILCEAGLISHEELVTMRTFGSRLQGHPDPLWLPELVEFAGGPLGQGLSFATGLSLGRPDDNVFALLGDGELQEGQVWEAVLSAPRLGANNLTAIIDWNGFQLSGPTPENPSIESMAASWASLGWQAEVMDGHDLRNLRLSISGGSDRPRVFFARTTKGRGVSFMENNNDFHGRELTTRESLDALNELGWVT